MRSYAAREEPDRVRAGRPRLLTLIAVAGCLLIQVASLIAQEGERAEKADTPPANPLSNLLNRVLGGGNNAVPGAGAEPGAEADSLEPRTRKFAGSSLEARRLAQADLAIAAQDWHTAVESLQWILDQPQDLIVPFEGAMGRTLQAEAEVRIGQLPQPALQAYEAEYGRIAAQLLEQAHGPQALHDTAVVANRFFHTAAGKQATAEVATLLFDRGEYDAAATWYSRLVGEPSFQSSVIWRARASYALMQAGDRAAAKPLLDSLAEHPASKFVTPGADDDLAAWILKQPAESAPIPQLDDWLTLYGTSAHVGVAPPSDPLLLKRWSLALTAREPLLQRIENLLRNLGDSRRAAIPSGIPIVVNGHVAFRTFHGLAVADIETGRVLWESDAGLTAEALLMHEALPDVNPYTRFRGFMDYGGSNPDQDSATTQLFRDDAYGMLSSDGRRVFSIENSVLQPPSTFSYFWPSNSPATQDPHQRDWSSNQVHAYDLVTGERLWEAGGAKMDEPFDPPLAGTFFFGPPVADGDELFVVGERDEQVHLFALASETGEPLWSQTIGEVDVTIERDLVRRLWVGTPAVDGGLVVCPTTTGWLVAVNRHTRRTAWAHRFSNGVENRGPAGVTAINTQRALNDRWCASAPIISGGCVYFAPPEQPDASNQMLPELICLDARTGAQRWSRPKGNSLYLAGVFDRRALVVGRDDIRLLGDADGLPVWTTTIPAEDGPPSGRGLALGGQFLLPLQSGQLWTIDLSDGRVTERVRLPDSPQGPMGNLAIWKGVLLSLGPTQLVGFEQRTQLQEEIAARLGRDPHDVWAAVRQAEIHRLAGDQVAALRSLEESDAGSTDDPQLIERHRRLTFDALIATLRSPEADDEANFERAAQLATATTERLIVERLRIDQAIAREQWEAAFDRCRRVADEYPLDEMVEDGPTSLRLDVWLGGRIADVTSQAPGTLADTFSEQIAALLESSSVAASASASLERMYGFHPAAQTFVWRLIEDAAYRKDFAGAELRLRRIIDGGERNSAGAAWARLGELLVEFGQPAEAAVVFARLADEYGDVLLPSLKTGAETAQERFASGAVTRADLRPPAPRPWSDGEYRIGHYRVVNSEYAMPQSPVTRQLCGPFYQRHTFEFDTQSPFLTVVNRADNSVYWRLPLRTGEQQSYQSQAVVFGQGLQAVVWHSGMLYALSLPERRVLWSRPASEQEPRMYSRGAYDNTVNTGLVASGSFAARVGLASGQLQTGLLAVANHRYVACHGRGIFELLDPLTGEVLWRRHGVAPDTSLVGDPQTLCIIPNQSPAQDKIAVRASDGRPVVVDGLPALLKSTIAVNASGWIRAERRTRARGQNREPVFQVFAYDPVRRTNAWSHEFGSKADVTFLDDSNLFVMDAATGECSLLNIDNGLLTPLGEAPKRLESQSSERHAVADARQVYVVINNSRNAYSNFVHIASVRTNGTILAFARDGTGLVWQQTVENQNLLLPGLAQLPLMVCLAYDHVHLAEIEQDYEKSRILVLDKSDGRIVVEDVRATPNGNYYRIDVSPDQRAIDIHSHNERVRIEAAPADRPEDKR